MYMYMYIYIYMWIHDAFTHSFHCIVRLSPIIDPRPLASRRELKVMVMSSQKVSESLP